MTRRLLRIAFALAAVALAAASAFTLASAQVDDAEERGAFIRFVENTISTPDRRIVLGAIEGALSSDVRISSITVADREGVWLTIEDVHLVWSRLALLRGRLDIDLLEAAAITVERPPLASEEAPTPAAAEPFTLPDLPVEIEVDRLAVPRVLLGEAVLGRTAELAVDGSASLADGEFAARLAIERTDDRPGRLALAADYGEDDGRLVLDLVVDEPEDGVIANLLGIPDRPSIRFTIAGEGPLDAFRADVGLAAAGRDLVGGAVTLSGVGGDTRVLADLSGTLAPLFPAAYAPWFEGTSSLGVEATRAADGAIDLERIAIRSGVASLDGDGRIAPDGFPTELSVSGVLDSGDGGRVPLPGAADAASVRSARFTVSFGGADETWAARFDVVGLGTPTLSAAAATVTARGTAADLQDSVRRRLTATVDGNVTGVTTEDPALARALGDRFDILARAAWTAGAPLAVEIAEIKNPNAALHFSGTVAGADIEGRTWLNAADVAPFAGLAGQDLAGALTFEARGRIQAATGAFDLVFDALGDDLATGIAAADALLAGESRLTGRAVRDTAGLRFDDLAVTTARVSARLDGSYDLARADVTLTASLADVAALTPRASGPVDLAARLTGSGVRPDVEIAASSPRLTLDGRRLTEARIGFEGAVDTGTGAVDGEVTARGFLDGVAVDASATVSSLADGGRRIGDLLFTAAGTRIAGDLALGPAGLVDGRVTVTSPDLSAVAPLALVEASGAVDADVTLSSTPEGTQSAAVLATVRRFQVETVSVADGAADLSVRDAFGVPAVDGRVAATGVSVGGTRIERLDLTARHQERTTDIDLSARLAAGDLVAEGALTAVDGGFDVALARLTLERGELSARLLDPVAIAVRDGRVTLPRTTLGVGSGRVTAEGRIAEALDLSVEVDRLPLALANAVQPDLGAAGTMSASLAVTGDAASPRADYSVTADGVSAAPLAAAGVPPLAVRARGRYADGTASVEGTLSGGGLELALNGRVPLSGGAMDLSVDGRAPLGLADPFLAERGARLSGTASVDVVVGGTLDSPEVRGAVAVDDATFTDPETGTRLTGILARVSFNRDRATVERLTGSLGGRGRIDVSGAIGLGADLPASLAVVIDDTRFTDGRIVTADVDGRLRIEGPLLAGVLVSGEIRVDRAEITVPETLPGGATFLDVRHRLPPPNVERTLERVRRTLDGDGDDGGAGDGPVLDVTIVAPRQIFVRGRGIDAELGGSVRVTGPLADVRPVGAFQLVRGRVVVIGQRIQFDRGTVTLLGDLDPVLDFTATTRSGTIQVTAQITGPASDPQIVLTSVPELPQDEVLARLLFGRGISDLSPLQIASLAAAVAELAGAGGGPGILDRLRQSTGLDDLEVVTDSEGNAAVQAGRYIADNVYLGVTAGPSGQANVSVNLDITDDLSARAEVGPGGGSKFGIFYETEY